MFALGSLHATGGGLRRRRDFCSRVRPGAAPRIAGHQLRCGKTVAKFLERTAAVCDVRRPTRTSKEDPRHYPLASGENNLCIAMLHTVRFGIWLEFYLFLGGGYALALCRKKSAVVKAGLVPLLYASATRVISTLTHSSTSPEAYRGGNCGRLS